MLSVMVIAKNEADNIGRCLESVQFADEVIVLDSGSEDATVAVARKYTDKVYTTDWQGYGVQKQRALAHCQGTWVLNLDADEWVDPALQAAIRAAIADEKHDAWRVPIVMNFYGKAIPHCASPSRHARLFRRHGAQFSDDLVHEKIILPEGARIGQLKTPIMHRSFRDVSHMIQKMNRYSSYSARIRLEQQQSAGLFRACVSSGWMFLRCYALQRGFLDGRAGFLFAAYNAQAAFYRSVKQIYPDTQQLD
ncbi:MAG: glycosyltransferase family 2 protein [Legionellaceae bacterium]|nr:glycosyltransferase family 2 protein [Legionellaceae bacterium]